MVNIQFGSNFMGRDDIHELTGETYLSTTLYGPRFFPKWLTPPHFPPRPGSKVSLVDRVRCKVFLRAFPSKHGTAYGTRKWPSVPYRCYYTLWKWVAARSCRYGIHLNKADITEVDASVYRAECMSCKTLVRAHKPQEASLERAREYMERNDEALRQHLEIVAYHEGRGPCPFCTPPDGQEHAPDCWEVEDPDF